MCILQDLIQFLEYLLAIAPDHKLSKILSKSNTNVREFIENGKRLFNEEMIDKGPKEGVFTSLFVKHPFTKKELPVYVANYVLSSYGSGAIFGVPVMMRDYLFASKYKLPIIKVVEPYDKNSSIPYTGPGSNKLIFLNNINTEKAKESIIIKLEEINQGKNRLNLD